MPEAADDRGGRRAWLSTGASWWKGLSRVWKILITGLGTLMLFIGARQQFFPATPPVERMTGDVNIAVAEFGSIGPDGDVAVSDESSRLSASVYEVLDRELSELETTAEGIAPDFEVQDPQVTGPVDGRTPEERTAQAREIGDRFSAGIVVYAVLDESDEQTSITPEFYLTERRLVLDAELVGEYQFGEALTGDTMSPEILARGEIRSDLVNRTTGLLRLIYGLSFFGSAKYEEALRAFDHIEAANLLTAQSGLEILYLFQANAAARMRDFDRAELDYARALAIRPGYARALVGRAEVAYQRSHGGCEEATIDAAGVRRAAEMYVAAGQSRDRPDGANIDLKVALGTGRAHLCLSLTRNDDAWEAARSELQTVVDAYEAGADGIDDIAAEALSSLGLLEMSSAGADEAALQRAVSDLESAIEIGPDSRHHVWFGLLGFARCRMADTAAATAAYDRAIELAPDDLKPEYAEAQTRAANADAAEC